MARTSLKPARSACVLSSNNQSRLHRRNDRAGTLIHGASHLASPVSSPVLRAIRDNPNSRVATRSKKLDLVASRRRTPIPTLTPVARPLPDGPATNGTAPSISGHTRIEVTLSEIQHTLAIQFQRIAAIQVELDKLAASLREHIAQTAESRRPTG